jgi:23S rRNA pseudouridine2604 synthase
MSAAPATRPAQGAGGGDSGDGERLSKRVAKMLGCSRREAEQTIEGGWVRVDGKVVEIPQHRVLMQTVTVDPDASLLALGEVTLILHKPPNVVDGVQDEAGHALAPAGPTPGRGRQARAPLARSARDLLVPANHSPHNASSQCPLLRHFKQLQASVPLETAASVLVVFTQDWRVQRKLQEDMAQM